MVAYGGIWWHMMAKSLKNPSNIPHMVLYGVIWCYMVLYGVIWCYMMLYDVIWEKKFFRRRKHGRTGIFLIGRRNVIRVPSLEGSHHF